MTDFIAHDSKVVRHSNAVAAGTTDIEPAAGIDCAGFDAVTFIAEFGAITASAVTTVKLQQSSESDGATDTFADIEGTEITVADDDDDKVAVLTLRKPQERYVRCVVTRATANAALEGITAILEGGRVKPVTHDATTVVGAELHVDAAEGTA